MLETIDKTFARMDFRKALEDIRDLLELETEKNFSAEKSPDGVKWESLRPSTLRKKRKNRHRILIEDEKLVGSLKGVASVEQLLGSTLDWGTNVRYARFHMTGTLAYKGQTTYGGEKTAKGMVKREFMGVTDPMADQMAELVADHAVKEIVESFDG